MSAKTYFLTSLFIFSVFLTLESVINASEEDNEIEIDVSESLTETITEIPAATIIAVKNVPKRHKLNAKQVLMLNQIVGGFTLDGVKDPLCKNHTMLYKQGLREFKPWAMKMFDASSKLQPGVLVGNTGEFGSFKECLDIKIASEYGPIRGELCTLKLVPGEKLTRHILNMSGLPMEGFDRIVETLKLDTLWSVCLPDSCPVSDVLHHFNRTLKGIAEGLEVDVILPEDGCVSYKSQKPITNAQWMAIILLGSIFAFVCLCTIYEIIMSYYDASEMNKSILMFSAVSNTKSIFENKSDAYGNELDCLNGVRSLSMSWVLIGHRYLITMFVPVVNGIETLNWTQAVMSTTVTGGTVSVDTFFMVSGLLVSYLFFGAMEKGVHFNLPLFYIHRYMRVTPVLAIVVLVYATIIDLWGSGPVWNGIVQSLKTPCEQYWWSCLLHIQNYVNSKHMCIVQTWYLTCDMQYYFFSPIILYPIWKWPHFGWFLYLIALIAAVGLNFLLAWQNQYNGGMPITNELLNMKYFSDHYTTPYTRASPYLIGIAMGYILNATKDKKVKMNSVTASFGWIASIVILLTITIGALPFQKYDHPYNRLESTIYLAFSRPVWALCLGWIVFNCINGTGGIINAFLSLYIFKVLAKLSYCMFLTHMLLMFTYSGAEKTTFEFSDLNMWFMTFGDFALCFGASYLLTICVEFPIIRLDSSLRKKVGKKKVDTK